jgi:purine-binding chemotaxis protein CheW
MSTVSDSGQNTAQQKQRQTGQSDEQLQLVTFCVNDEQYAVDILRVQEINRMLTITQVPQSPPGVEGVINLRGRIIPIMDLRIRFGMPKGERTDESRIMVVESGGTIVGFIVDRVHEVLRISRTTVDPAPAMSSTVESRYIDGVAKMDDRLIILLDLDALLSEQPVAQMANTARLAA